MKKAIGIVAVLIAVQAALLLGYRWLSRREAPELASAESLDRPAPELVYRARDGSEHRLSELAGAPVVVHFWATWCPPCRKELPSLLEYAEEGGARVLAVSLNPSWRRVAHFFGNQPAPPAVVLAASETAPRPFEVDTLPETFVVDGRGKLVLRLRGAQDWSRPEIRRAVARAVKR